jgi:hypothetical protein
VGPVGSIVDTSILTVNSLTIKSAPPRHGVRRGVEWRPTVEGVLRLEVRDYTGPARWRWVLTDASRAFIADHEVRVDEHSSQYEAFTDLEYYISSYAAVDRYAEDEARIVAKVGQWLGSEVFGQIAELLVRAARRAPVTVRVVVPEDARALLFRPFELAYTGGRPLAAQDVTLVMQTADDDCVGNAVPVGNRLRVLGLFNLPEGGHARAGADGPDPRRPAGRPGGQAGHPDLRRVHPGRVSPGQRRLP